MPYDKNKQQRYAKITVYFKSGTKVYRMSLEKKPEFLKKLRMRNDVIKHTSEVIRNNIY